jgi:hypothetical protein
MKSVAPGLPTSPVEVTNVSPHGFWLFVGERELFLPFRDFPWFKEASIAAITHVELPSPHHLYWPDLDVDLAVDSIEAPDRYPLMSRGTTITQGPPAGRRKPTLPRRRPKRA